VTIRVTVPARTKHDIHDDRARLYDGRICLRYTNSVVAVLLSPTSRAISSTGTP